ncbi:MAG: hypothetical protein LBU05_00240 [Bifidobacteriaceae bacterium]|jgi:hypothetical protein|nr:hypothetical protein [Bifidobacteriaceae bacterium]
MTKRRITITADAEAIDAGLQAVANGEHTSLSEWANRALGEQAIRDSRHRELAAALAVYEAEHGIISAAEMVAQDRADGEAAIVVHTHRAAHPLLEMAQ